ncbi:MAG: hypothetical protein Q4G69_10780 [Planctomycetia bacterium]|nr:hypothetical protein [Planctomycetia bacterium]
MKTMNLMILFFLLTLMAGCAKKEIPLENIKLLAAVKTGIAIESQKQIAACRREMEKKDRPEPISPDLEKNLTDIILLAENGKWKDAEKQILKLQKKYITDSKTVPQQDPDRSIKQKKSAARRK